MPSVASLIQQNRAMGIPAACLFDLDGLLLDTEPLHARAWNEAASQFGCPLSAEQLLALRGRRRLDCARQVQAWIAGRQGGAPAQKQLLAVRQPIAENLLVQAQPMAGARDLVNHCARAGIPMALATSSAREAVALKTAPHPWLNQIGVRVHGDDPELRAGKPAPDVFLLAAARLGVPANEHCWAFEDSPAGAEAALQAGCRVLVVPPAQLDSAQLTGLFPRVQAPPHRMLRSLEEVLEEFRAQ
jgi:HAD superfamily hydrolase (TIGR01509 family)